MESVALQEFVLRLAACGRLWWVHLSPPGAGWSLHLAQHAVQRASDRPIKREPMVTFMARLCDVLSGVGSFWSIENPPSSRLWSVFPIAALARKVGVHSIALDFKDFGGCQGKATF
eukprot:5552192-Amphidinium_carterae.1